MRILLFCAAELSNSSGSTVRAGLLAKGLRAAGADVGICAFGAPPELEEEGIALHLFAPESDWGAAMHAAANIFRPDVLYGITEAGATDVAMAAAHAGVPAVFDLHGLGFVEVIELGKRYGSRKDRVLQSFRWLGAARRAAAVTVANPTLFPVVRPFARNAVPVFGMTDLSRFRPDVPAKDLGGAAGSLRVLYAGNFFRWQGIDLLLAAARIVFEAGEQITFTLVGSPRGNDDLVSSVRREFPPEKVRVLDPVPQEDVPALCRGADVLVVPRPFLLSTYLAFPQKIPDGMASGRVIVATDLAPHRWALSDPPAGILCRPRPRDLAEALRRARDPELRRRLGENARRTAEERFDHRKQSARALIALATATRGGRV